MLLGFGYVHKFAMIFSYSFQKAENNRLKKANCPKFCDLLFFCFCLK